MTEKYDQIRSKLELIERVLSEIATLLDTPDVEFVTPWLPNPPAESKLPSYIFTRTNAAFWAHYYSGTPEVVQVVNLLNAFSVPVKRYAADRFIVDRKSTMVQLPWPGQDGLGCVAEFYHTYVHRGVEGFVKVLTELFITQRVSYHQVTATVWRQTVSRLFGGDDAPVDR